MISLIKKNSMKRMINCFFLMYDYIILVYIITMTGGGWINDANLSLTLEDQFMTLLSLLVIYVALHLIVFGRLYLSKDMISRLVIICICIYTFSFFNATNPITFKRRYTLIPIWLLLWILSHEDTKEIWHRFIVVVCIFACASLFFYFFGSILNIIPEYNIADRVWGKWKPDRIRNFYYLYYESHLIRIGDFILWRNVGVFAEAPMHNFILCTALGGELFLKEKQSKTRVIILSITIISTFSTTGFIFLTLALFFYVFSSPDKFPIVKKIIPYLHFILILIFLIMIGFVALKLISPNGRGSLTVRFDHLIACLKAFKDNIFFGCGWRNNTVVMSYMKHVQGLSVGLPSFMAYGGLLLSSSIFIPLFSDFKKSVVMHEYKEFFFEFLFIVLFFFTIVNSYPILWTYIAYSAVNDINPKHKKHEVSL